MSLMRARTPNQLTAMSVTGLVISGLPFVCLQQDKFFLHAHIVVAAVFVFGLLLGGLWLSAKAAGEIKDGIASERWTEHQLRRLRTQFPGSWLTGTASLLTLTSVVVICPTQWSKPIRGYGWAVYLIGMGLIRLAGALKLPRPTIPRTTIWNGMKPINSEHWGNR